MKAVAWTFFNIHWPPKNERWAKRSHFWNHLIWVPVAPAVDFLLPPAAWCHSGEETGDIPKEMLSPFVRRTVIYSDLPPLGNVSPCPPPSVLNPQRLKHMEIDNSGITVHSLENVWHVPMRQDKVSTVAWKVISPSPAVSSSSVILLAPGFGVAFFPQWPPFTMFSGYIHIYILFFFFFNDCNAETVCLCICTCVHAWTKLALTFPVLATLFVGW